MRLLSALLAAALTVLAAGAVGASPSPKPQPLTELLAGEEVAGPTSVHGQTQPIYPVSLTESYEIDTPYGTIRGDVQRPVVGSSIQVPVILTYTPYSVLYQSLDPRRESRADDSTADYFVPRGYARAVFDVVGTFGSDGCTDFGGFGERETAAAVVDFLGSREWSNGNVGMIGGSYDGTTAIAAAVEAPEHLRTIIPQVAIDRWYDYMFNDGVRMTLEDNPTGLADPPIDSPADYDFAYGVIPPYHLIASDPQGVAEVLLDHTNPCHRAENQLRGNETDPIYDGFWVERDYRALADEVEASVLLEGAWLDDNVKHWATTRFFQAMTARAESEDDAPQTRMVLGQWSHSASRFSDATQLRHAWFDFYLHGLDTQVDQMPPVQTQGSDGEIRFEAAWPPAGTAETVFPLHDMAGDQTTWTDLNPGQDEQQIARANCTRTCVRFVTEPIAEDSRIIGPPVLDATFTTADAASTHITPVLSMLSPTGVRTAVTRGLMNSNQRNGLHLSTPLRPGEAWMARIELWDTDFTVPAGYSLELTLASTNATWGLADETRATTSIDRAASTLTVPLLPLDTSSL